MEKDIQEMLDFFASDDCNIWELDGTFGNAEDAKTLKKMFPEPMFFMLKTIIKKTVEMIEYHNGNDSEPHENIRTSIRELRENFKSHRHELGKTYSAKPE